MLIFSENPEKDIWRELLQFSYEANVKRYIEKRGQQADQETINCITGSFLQAYEYFRSAKDANLQIAPLLLYYGTANLFYGMENLLAGQINTVSNHGMRIEIPEKMDFIADTRIRFISPRDGGVHVAARAIGYMVDLTKCEGWELRDFFDSIAEINSEYLQFYEKKAGRIAMLDVFDTSDGEVEKLYFTDDDEKALQALLEDIEGFQKSYLPVGVGEEPGTGRKYFILRHKMSGEDIHELSYSGQPYLRAGHRKNKQLITLPTPIVLYISLFTLASLCRYHPEHWSPFVLKDTTGEKLLIEKLLFFAGRMLPNHVLNKVMGTPVQYTANRYTKNSTIKWVSEHQVREIVKREIGQQAYERDLQRRISK